MTWGLAADEFQARDEFARAQPQRIHARDSAPQDSEGWPPQLYVREGRRMVGTYVFTQNDRQYNTSKADSIGAAPASAAIHPVPAHTSITHHAGLFSYNIDSHHTQRVVGVQGALKGWAMNEGDFELYGGPLGTAVCFANNQLTSIMRLEQPARAAAAAVLFAVRCTRRCCCT